jgi:DNA-binding PadR family transcriptional regulator
MQKFEEQPIMETPDDPAVGDKAFRRLNIKLTRETLWIYILRLLQDKPMYGYEIRDNIQDRFDFNPARVTTYVVLYKMAKEGLVDSEWQKSPSGKPDRKYYAITKFGEEMMGKASEFMKEIIDQVFDKTQS